MTNNTKVTLNITMSLDGFIAGPNNPGKSLHHWLFGGDTPSAYNDFFNLSKKSAKVLDSLIKTTGAIVTGRRTYDITNGWNGKHPFPRVPVFVVTLHAPEKVPAGPTPFTFVSEGIERAVSQAKQAAGKKNVYVLGGATVAQQCLKEGLLDHMTIHVVPVLLGGGVRLFGDLQNQIDLEQAKTIEAPGVTHLQFLLKDSSR